MSRTAIIVLVIILLLIAGGAYWFMQGDGREALSPWLDSYSSDQTPSTGSEAAPGSPESLDADLAAFAEDNALIDAGLADSPVMQASL